jgi:hypothetical protein
MKNLILKTIVLLLTFLPTLAFAGPGFGGGVNDGGNCSVPLDGGLGLLAASGVGYGVRTYMNLKKKRKKVHAE